METLPEEESIARLGRFRSPVPAIVSLTVAALVLGHALQVADGFYEPRALLALSLALVFTIAGVLIMPSGGLVRGRTALVHIALTAAIGVQLLVLFRSTPGMYLEEGARLDLFAAGVAIEAALVAVGTLGLRWFTRWWFPAVLVVNIALGVWMLRASPHPRIDVVEVHSSALQALGRGRNPYRITFRNIYGPDTSFYNPQAVSGDRVLIGYPYPPLSLLVAAPGHLIFRDYRYAELAALVGAAALIGYAGASLAAKLAAVLLLTTPRAFFVLEQGWTEPIAVLMLAAMTWAMIRRPAWCPWIGGLLAVTKQYLGLSGPLLWRFARSRSGGRLAVPRSSDRRRSPRHPALCAARRARVCRHRDSVADEGAVPHRVSQLRELGGASRMGPGFLSLGGGRWTRGADAGDVAHTEQCGRICRRSGPLDVRLVRDGFKGVLQLLLLRHRRALLHHCRACRIGRRREDP